MTEAHHGTLLGDLYARWTLDCLVEIAHAVANDYVGRPDSTAVLTSRIISWTFRYRTDIFATIRTRASEARSTSPCWVCQTNISPLRCRCRPIPSIPRTLIQGLHCV